MSPIARRGLLFIEEILGLGFQMGQMGWNGLGPKSKTGCTNYFHFILWCLSKRELSIISTANYLNTNY
jgi:hypothetical protein